MLFVVLFYFVGKKTAVLAMSTAAFRLGGTSPGRRLLSRGPSRRLELCDFDDGSGRQRWQAWVGTSAAVVG